MKDLPPTQARVLLELADEMGHANRELADKLGVDKSTTLKVLQQLEKRGLVEQRGHRDTTNPKSNRPKRKEFPYYLVPDIPASFQRGDIVYPLTLLQNLFNQEYEPALYIQERFSPAISDVMNQYNRLFEKGPKEFHLTGETFDRTLIDELNTLIEGPSLFNKDAFKNVILRQKTKALINRDPQGTSRRLLNRLLMEDAFPCNILKGTAIQLCHGLILYLIKAGMYDELERFLKSKYVTNIIENDGFLSFHTIIRDELGRKEVCLAVSRSILTLPSVISQFEELTDIYMTILLKDYTSEVLGKDIRPEMMAKYCIMIPRMRYGAIIGDRLIRRNSQLIILQAPRDDVEFQVLSKYDPLIAIRLCRNNLLNKCMRFFAELEERALITPGLRKFLEIDAYLSPFTSYPVNEPEVLLFSPPFQRIYENVYLLDKTDLPILIQRARIIYANFSDLLLDRLKALARSELRTGNNSDYKVNQEVLAMEIRSFLFYWNTIGTRFDIIVGYVLPEVYGMPWKFHLWSDGMNFHVTDIDNNQEVIRSGWQASIMNAGILPSYGSSRIMENPSAYLRPCQAFNIRSEKQVPFQEILEDLKAKVVEQIEKGFRFEIDW